MHLVERTDTERAESLVWGIGFHLLEMFGENHPQFKQFNDQFNFLMAQPATTFEQMERLYKDVSTAFVTHEDEPTPLLERTAWTEVGGD